MPTTPHIFKALLLFSYAIGLLLISSCNLEKDIEVELPPFTSELMVECYLIPGEPYRLLLSETVAYFSEPELPIISGAQVNITHRGETTELVEGLFIDNQSQKLFNYGNTSALVPFHYNEPFYLEITDSLGRHVEAQAMILPPIPIDTLELEFDDSDTLALVLTRVTDPADQDNFYRRILKRGETVPDSFLEQDFITDDRFLGDDHQLVFGSGFDFAIGDTLHSMIYHIEEAYRDFYISVESAISSNGNPFVTPGALQSNVTGGVGIFTGLSYDVQSLIVGQ